MRIVDAHHHIWRRADLPWLLGPTQPRIFGAYDAIKRDYPIEEYRADVEGTGVDRSVYVQANWAPNWFADEVAWVSRTAERSGWPHAIVGYIDMRQKDARADLDRLAAYPLVRGVRHQMHWHENPLYRFAPGPEVVASERVIANVARLADYGFVFELQVFARQVEAALKLADANERVTFVLQHALMLEDLSDEGRSHWAEALDRLAQRPNVVCKLSGFGTFIRRLDARHVAWVTHEAVARFGPKRCLFGSNFPIEKIWTDYRSLLDAHLSALQDHDEEARDRMLRKNAKSIYRLAD